MRYGNDERVGNGNDERDRGNDRIHRSRRCSPNRDDRPGNALWVTAGPFVVARSMFPFVVPVSHRSDSMGRICLELARERSAGFESRHGPNLEMRLRVSK